MRLSKSGDGVRIRDRPGDAGTSRSSSCGFSIGNTLGKRRTTTKTVIENKHIKIKRDSKQETALQENCDVGCDSRRTKKLFPSNELPSAN
jgi:hypothetical protein